jgi:hypothetical protein
MKQESSTFPAEKQRTAVSEEYEQAAEYLDKFRDLLEDESDHLRQAGFPVSTDCRIDPAKTNFLPESNIQAHRNQVQLERNRQKENTGEDKEKRDVGELLEVVLLLSLNKLWFDGRLVAVRASLYDDYFNGIDTLIIDTKTGVPIAAVDEATVGGMATKNNRSLRKKIEEGATMTYGVEINDSNKVIPRSYKNLPVFLISVTRQELLQLAKDLDKGRLTEFEIVQEIIEGLEEQAYDAVHGDPEDDRSKRGRYDNKRTAPKINRVVNPVLRKAYRRAGEIIKEL